VYEVARESVSVIYEFQKAQRELLQSSSKDLSMKYLLAMVNNNAKAYDYTEEFEFKGLNLCDCFFLFLISCSSKLVPFICLD
jgi:hypothetical protein